MVGSFRGSVNKLHNVDTTFLEVRDFQSDDDDDHDMDDDDSDESSDDEGVSIASSVPTTVPSVVDERTAASIMAQKESQRVFFSKLMVISIFMVVAVFVTVAVYGFANLDENENLQQTFGSYADEILDLSNVHFQDFISKSFSFGVSITGLAIASNSTWPMISIADFEAQASHYITQATANSVSMAMMVTAATNNNDNNNQNQKEEWEVFANTTSSQSWITKGYEYLGLDTDNIPDIIPYIFRTHNNGTIYKDNGNDDTELFAPLWMGSPPNEHVTNVNYNAFDAPAFRQTFDRLVTHGDPYSISPPQRQPGSVNQEEEEPPQSIAAIPIYKDFQTQQQNDNVEGVIMVATLLTSVSWDTFFSGILQEGTEPIDLILEDTCNDGSSSSNNLLFVFSIEGPTCTYMGTTTLQPDDHPQSEFGISSTASNIRLSNGCTVIIHLYPSTDLVESSGSNRPGVYTLSIILVFCVMFVFFLAYDRCVSGGGGGKGGNTTGRNGGGLGNGNGIGGGYTGGGGSVYGKTRGTESFFEDGVSERHGGGHGASIGASRHGITPLIMAKPIADLHPNATVLFADIANFMAWSSVREPSQVFMLLETLFNAYDKLAKKYKVFKVETIGDCYVAVTGLPEACPDHAILMVRFAHDALIQMRSIVKQLEVLLGPDTAELAMRVGLHSGPVIAGVLRGEKSRFQLFGAAVNTAATIESTGMKNRIHASSDTAEQIRENGFPQWLVKREKRVSVKGKGEIDTYWVKIDDSPFANIPTSGGGAAGEGTPEQRMARQQSGREKLNMSTASVMNPDEKVDRLISWSADLLLGLLKRIIAMRESEEELKEKREFEAMVQELDEETEIASRISHIDGLSQNHTKKSREPKIAIQPGQTILDEVKEIITLPRKANKYQQDPNLVPVSQDVVDQLTAFVTDVALMYRDNPFHNFEHASHVTQSLTKLLSRVVTEDEIDYENLRYKKKAGTSKLHKFTFGITSDPITQFACALSAIIHDLDHPGVPNAVLVKEETRLAQMYRSKSVAEQNSVDLAWSLLMEPRFKDLRGCIYKSQNELDRFRQLVVNSVMATDIVDKELGALRKKRWEKAFNKEGNEYDEARDEVNRKATIVIEHLIQAADVAHTMQHWHVYLKWNERFFHECYQVYLSGRSETDPSEGWYKGEIGFFDFYIIPLAKKLENCGVFGVSSDECLQYATANRNEWERKGKDIVATYLSAYDENGNRIS